ncbi:HNH endonuclease signature motif containing protein [Pseudarthrobacter phenanthrenivorans]|uniref:HNH endonuclease signature motif containing protein n=1 Tax=Pseudarthrobacter phenanthrenivorans TaxID=361575 RepID=UPI00068B5075|nr:HNH endonuclease signature motif containing protein [Pseudarthrobacter phenanthrenivorans]
MGTAAVVKAFGDIRAALAVLNAELDGAGAVPFSAADPLAGLADGCLEILAGAREVEAGFAGLKAKAAVTYTESAFAVAGPDTPVVAQEMAVTAEIGCVLALGPRAAGSFLATSHAVVSSLPRTLAGLQAGTISWQHAVVMADETAGLDAAGAAALESHFLDPDAPDPARGCPAGQLPAHRFRAKARSWRERHHAESIETRHDKGVVERRVEFRPDRDGMAWLSACLPADQALAGWNRLTAVARSLQGPDETRTLTQLRADLFAATVLGGCTPDRTDAHGTAGGANAHMTAASTGVSGAPAGRDASTTSTGTDASPATACGARARHSDSSGGGDCLTAAGSVEETDLPPTSIRAQVLVTVPVFSLLGLADEPAMLDGYGPIPASMARELVASGAESFHRVLVDPRDGAPLEIGRTSYRLTKAMRAWLRLRDGKCPFPGCSNHSLDNEADHLLAWANGGTTGISNLGQPCPKHHKLRHTTGWTPTPATKNEPPGWTSPTGRYYASEHQDWEPPHWPPGFLPRVRSKIKQRIPIREPSHAENGAMWKRSSFSSGPCPEANDAGSHVPPN